MPVTFAPVDPLEWTPDHEAVRVPDGSDPYLRAVMVSSVDGAGTRDGRSGALSCPADRHLMRLLRTTSDAVLVGAGTARVENYGPPRLPEDLIAWRQAAGRGVGPRLVLVTARLSLDAASRIFEPWDGERPLVLTDAASAAEHAEEAAALARVAEVVALEGLTPRSVVAAMVARGLRRIVTEGGPHWLRDCFADDVVDELWLTLSPVVLGGQAGRIVRGPDLPSAAPMTLQGVGSAEDFLFLRYVSRGRR